MRKINIDIGTWQPVGKNSIGRYLTNGQMACCSQECVHWDYLLLRVINAPSFDVPHQMIWKGIVWLKHWNLDYRN